MKTKEQVNRYVAQCSFPKDDWKMVLSFCKQNKVGYAHKASNPKSESTYLQFLEWFNNGVGSGEVVRYGHTTGIVSIYTPDYCELCAYFAFDGRLVIASLAVPPKEIFVAQESERTSLYNELKMMGLDYDERLARIYRRSLPKTNAKIKYSHNGRVGYGIIKGFDNGFANFLFVIENSSFIQDISIPLNELEFDIIDKKGIETMTSVLDANLLKWNYEKCELETLEPRAKLGHTYWYITDKFSVSSAIENRTPTNEARFYHGNYFLNHSEAMEFLVKIRAMRKKKK